MLENLVGYKFEGFWNLDRNTLGTVFVFICYIKTVLFKMLIWCTFKIFIDLSNSHTVSYFFVVYNSNCMFLLTIGFFQLWHKGTPPSYVSGRYVGMIVAVI